MKGKIKWFDTQRGYGFIESDDGRNVFCHRSELDRPGIIPQVGLKLHFNIRRVPRGISAINIQLPENATFKTPSLKHLPIYHEWHATFRNKVLKATSHRRLHEESVLATLEAVTRAARKNGWAVSYTSNHKHRVSSRYIKTSDGICRLSNHSLDRPHRRYWNGEVLITKTTWQTTNIDAILKQIEEEARKPKYDS